MTTCLLLRYSAFANTKPDSTQPIVFDVISLGVDAVLCHDQNNVNNESRYEWKIHALNANDIVSDGQYFK